VQGDDAITARTADGQEIKLDVTTIYRINPERVNDVHRNWPNDRFRNDYVRPLMRNAVYDAVSLFPVEDIYQERATIDEEIEQIVIPALEKEGFILEDVLVRNITFSPEYIAAIELAQVAEVQIREQEFRVQQAEQEAEQVRVRAQGQADARVIQAQAEAQALQLVADVLAQNPQLIEYQYVQNLSDQVEVLALPSTSPYIFDLSSFINRPTNPEGN
jgi:regulator of protease activity HflC (stomatin/prohibitin superfamily)